MKLAKDMVEEYKSIREIVQEGDFFRLENTSTNNYHLFEYTKTMKLYYLHFFLKLKLDIDR